MVIICLGISDCPDAVERFNLLIEIIYHCISQRLGASKKIKMSIKIYSMAIHILFNDKKVIDPLKNIVLPFIVGKAYHLCAQYRICLLGGCMR